MELNHKIINLDVYKKQKGDKRKGDYWISYYDVGCGCCRNSYLKLFNKETAIEMIEKYIQILENKLTIYKITIEEIKNNQYNIKR